MTQFLWKSFQLSIFIGVVFSNIYFEWGADGYAASFLGLIAAAIASGIVVEIIDKSVAADQWLKHRWNSHVRRLPGQ